MAITIFGGASGAVANAYMALRSEETQLVGKLKILHAQLDQVRAAMTAMKPLLPKDIVSTDEDEADDVADETSTGLASNHPYSGLTFSKALHKFMLGSPSMNPPDIAKQFEQSGWQFSNPQTTHKTNQVGVTLRRFRGKLFEQAEDGKWFAVPA